MNICHHTLRSNYKHTHCKNKRQNDQKPSDINVTVDTYPIQKPSPRQNKNGFNNQCRYFNFVDSSGHKTYNGEN
jgi:hypothetical protein